MDSDVSFMGSFVTWVQEKKIQAISKLFIFEKPAIFFSVRHGNISCLKFPVAFDSINVRMLHRDLQCENENKVWPYSL